MSKFCPFLADIFLSTQLLKNYRNLSTDHRFYHFLFVFWTVLDLILKFFFMRHSNNFCKIKFFFYIYLYYSVFNFFNDKNFTWPIWSVAFWKNILMFWYYHIIPNFKFWIFIIIFNMKVDICTRLNIYGVICINLWCSMICIIVFINYII